MIKFDIEIIHKSPWAFFLPFSLSFFILFLILSLKGQFFPFLLFFSFFFTCLTLSFWIYELYIGNLYSGSHTLFVQNNIYSGLILFIFSEFLLFSSFFFSFFYNSLIPSIEFSYSLPPLGLYPISFKGVVLFNTILLFLSAFTSSISFSLHSPLKFLFNFFTIFYGSSFLFFQFFEYLTASFTINDSVYASNLFLLSGFHGLHVFIGLLFLSFSYYLAYFDLKFIKGFWNLFSNLYWHFVDFIWIFLFLFLYCWYS